MKFHPVHFLLFASLLSICLCFSFYSIVISLSVDRNFGAMKKIFDKQINQSTRPLKYPNSSSNEIVEANRGVNLVTEENIDAEVKRLKLFNCAKELIKDLPKRKRFPDFIGVGVNKCGTFALWDALEPHPLIQLRHPYEAKFLNKPEAHLQLGLEAYRDSMSEAEELVMVAEKTPGYFNKNLDTPSVVKNLLPDAKLIVILCDPVKWVVSNYVFTGAMRKARGEKLNLFDTRDGFVQFQSQVILKELKEYNFDYEPSWEFAKNLTKVIWPHFKYFKNAMYDIHLWRYLQYYNSSNLLVINASEMMEDLGGIVEIVQEFLGLPKLLLRSDYVKNPKTGFFCRKDIKTQELSCLRGSKMRTRNGRFDVLSAESTIALQSFYRPHVARLEKMLNRKMNWW